MGKLGAEELQKLLSCIKKDERLIVPPLSGYDSGVHLMGDKYMVVSTDPCIGVPEEWFGWLLVHYAASDVALFAAKPEFCTLTLLGPLSITAEQFQAVMRQACEAVDELGMAIVRGHTGTYSGLLELTGVCTAYGTVEPAKLITSGNAKPEDYILCTKSLGLETVVNFSLIQKELALRLFGGEQTKKLQQQVKMQSCVREALLLANIDGVHAMHDATEGGVVVALNEMAEASGVGFEVEMEKIPVSREVQILREYFKLSDEQMLSLSSTGTILAAVDVNARDEVERTLLGNGFSASFLGTYTQSKERVLVKNKKTAGFPQVSDDTYSKILSAHV